MRERQQSPPKAAAAVLCTRWLVGEITSFFGALKLTNTFIVVSDAQEAWLRAQCDQRL